MYRKNTAGQFVCFQGVDASTGGIKSGVTWTMRRCLDGTFAAGGGTVTEDSTNGWYKCALAQADTNGNNCSFNFTGSGAVPQTVNIVTTAADPTDAVRLGLTALPNAAAGATGGLPLSVDASGRVDVLKVNGTSQTAKDLGASATQTGDNFARLGAPAGASVSADIAAVQADLPQRFTKNVALSGFTFPMVLASDHVTGATGKTVTATRSIDGAAFAACTNSPAEVSSGFYKIDLSAADLNGNTVTFLFTAAACDPTRLTIVTEPT